MKPASPAPTCQLPRERGRFRTMYHNGDLYSDDWSEEVWTPAPNGPTVLSRLRGNPEVHAPLFDVDFPMIAINDGPRTTVSVAVDRRAAKRLRRGLATLVTNGWVAAADHDAVFASADAASRRFGRAHMVTVPLQLPVRAVASRTAGHHHLFVETEMGFSDSVVLARALGFVDRRYIAVCTRGRTWQLNTPHT